MPLPDTVRTRKNSSTPITSDKGVPDKSTKTSNRNLAQGQQTDTPHTSQLEMCCYPWSDSPLFDSGWVSRPWLFGRLWTSPVSRSPFQRRQPVITSKIGDLQTCQMFFWIPFSTRLVVRINNSPPVTYSDLHRVEFRSTTLRGGVKVVQGVFKHTDQSQLIWFLDWIDDWKQDESYIWLVLLIWLKFYMFKIFRKCFKTSFGCFETSFRCLNYLQRCPINC